MPFDFIDPDLTVCGLLNLSCNEQLRLNYDIRSFFQDDFKAEHMQNGATRSIFGESVSSL